MNGLSKVLRHFFSDERLWGLVCLVVALSPTYLLRFHTGNIPWTVFEILILLLVVLTALRAILFFDVRCNYLAKLRTLPPELIVATALFFIAGTFSVLVAPDRLAALGIWRAYFVEAILFGLVAFLHLKNKQQLIQLATAVSITAAVVALVGIVQKFTGWGIPNPFWRAVATRRVTSIFGYPNAVGLYLEMVIPFMVALFFISRNRALKMWVAGVVGASGAAILFSHSAGAVTALLGTTALFLLVIKKTRATTLVVCIISAIIILATPLKKPFAEQFLFQSFSGGLRVQMWGETIEMLRERPLLGAGLSGYQKTVKQFHANKKVEIYLYPHNLVLTLWSEIGLLGLIAFAWVFALCVRYVFAVKDFFASALLAVFLIMFIHGIVDIPYFKNDLAAIFWLGVAVAVFLRYTGKPHEV